MPETFPLSTSPLEIRGTDKRVILSLPALHAPPGAMIGIRGPSGAGKSTLLYAIAGLLGDVEGSIQWGATDILGLSESERTNFRAGHIGMVFQESHLFEELGAQDNAGITALFRPRAARKIIAARAALHLKALGVNASTRTVTSFSGGERQRVAIARALATDAPILLADEPTASLDRATSDRLIKDVINLVRLSGKTLITVSHDPHLIEQMDRVLTITDGALTDDWSAR